MSKTGYKVGDVVWARKNGRTWWPAVVTSLSSNKSKVRATAQVNLIGKKASPKLPLTSLKHFGIDDEVNLRSDLKLRAAVFAARRIFAGKSTFEGIVWKSDKRE